MGCVPWENETERADWYKKQYEYAQKRLDYYEDLKNQKRLIELPCSINDIVYGAEDEPVVPLHVMDIGFYLEGENGGDWESLSNIGKTVFLTEEQVKEVKEDEKIHK